MCVVIAVLVLLFVCLLRVGCFLYLRVVLYRFVVFFLCVCSVQCFFVCGFDVCLLLIDCFVRLNCFFIVLDYCA